MTRARITTVLILAVTMIASLALSPRTTVAADQLPRPDGKPADMSKPVQVYILLGQSNMVGAGKVGPVAKDGSLEHAVKEKKKYPYLIDDAGAWTVRNDVRNVRVMGSGGGPFGKAINNEWMTVKGGTLGPEYGIGHKVGNAVDAPVMILKSCIGNRSLAWDLLPPGSERQEVEVTDKKTGEKKTIVVPAYHDKVRHPSWDKGTTPEEPKHTWYAGLQYDGDIQRAKQVLADLNTYYPQAKGYEVAGFFWWQGDKDRYNEAHAALYEQNLVHLIKTLRKEFNAPHAKFVCATLGQTEKGADGNDGKILNAMLAVDGGSGKYPQFKGNVATVYSHPLSLGGASNGHYGGNAETYMNIGEAMGQAMVELLKADAK
ncbi:MAG: sialate O-acetylesterase [Phycisphaeraceae bacterium]